MKKILLLKKTNTNVARSLSFVTVSLLLLSITVCNLNAQAKGYTISGTIYEQESRVKKIPTPGAVVSLHDYSIHVTSDRNGIYELTKVPAGETTLSIKSLGKVTIDTLIRVDGDLTINFVLKDDNFRLEDVTVIAETGKAGEATSSLISRSAMDHLQATSLKDVLSLIPGGLADNQDLSYASGINLRSIIPQKESGYATSDAHADANALGVSIIQDGSPMSNNANLQTLNNALVGTSGANKNIVSTLGGGASPGSGVDARNISMENVESVEIIRGIASVQYGDMTSGVVIINTKAGREPLRVSAKTNPNLYQFSAGAGYRLGEKTGALNFNIDYTKNTNNVVHSYIYYSRISSKLMYSNTFLNNRWRTNTTLDFIHGQDRRKQNPDDTKQFLESKGTHQQFKLTTNGNISLDWGWLRNINYVLSASYTKSDNYRQINTQGDFYYSSTMTDGAILGNVPGMHLYDIDGNRITNWGESDKEYYSLLLPHSYIGRNTIEGREINVFGKLTGTLVKRVGILSNRILFGGDFKVDGNEGRGVMFSPTAPPARSLSDPYSTFRPRSFKDIPYIKQFGTFLEENMELDLGGHKLVAQAGLRYDHVSGNRKLWAPRVNASFEVLPKHITIRGGFGVAGKMPSLVYLHPEDAYFALRNLDSMKEPLEENRHLVTTTRMANTTNKQLEIAKNKKTELGIDLRYKQYRLSITAFEERMNNGYTITETPTSHIWTQYQKYDFDATKGGIVKKTDRDSDGNVIGNGLYNTFLQYSTPTNDLVLNNKGIEVDLNLGRFDAIRTAFSITGLWARTETYNKGPLLFNKQAIDDKSTHIGIYEDAMQKRYYQRLTSALRITHNIPEIGFVITLTTQVTWNEKDWYKIGNDSIPVRYISKNDGVIRDFPYKSVEEVRNLQQTNPNLYQEFSPMMRNYDNKLRITESLPPLVCFNINVTKEIKDFMRISFFANNMFRYYNMPISDRDPAKRLKRNPKLFFGIELSLTIK